MKNSNEGFVFGSVYYMYFCGSKNEQRGWRPGVVFQNNKANIFSPNIIALPCTTSIKKTYQPTHVYLSSADSGLTKDSIVLCENPQRMSKEKIGSFITVLPEKYIKEIAIANLLSSSAISFIPYDELSKVWRYANKFNGFGGAHYV